MQLDLAVRSIESGVCTVRHIGLIAAISAGLLATAAAESPAQATGQNGSIVTTISGVPSSLPVGGSFQVTFTIRSTSPYRIDVDDFYLSMWNMAQAGFSQPTGISVLWNDPATGAWRASDHIDSNGGWVLNEPNLRVWVEPHGTLAVRARVTMSDAAARGTVHLGTNGISGYELFTTSGQNVAGALDNYNQPQTTFRYGAGAGGTGPTHAAASTRPPASAHTSAAPVAAPATSTPPTTAAPATPVSSPPAPSPTATTAPDATASPSPTTLPLAATGGSGTGPTPYAAAVAAILVAAVGAGTVSVRRRRINRPTADGDSEQ